MFPNVLHALLCSLDAERKDPFRRLCRQGATVTVSVQKPLFVVVFGAHLPSPLRLRLLAALKFAL